MSQNNQDTDPCDKNRFDQCTRHGPDRTQNQRCPIITRDNSHIFRQTFGDFLQSRSYLSCHLQGIVPIPQMNDTGDNFIAILFEHSSPNRRAPGHFGDIAQSQAAAMGEWDEPLFPGFDLIRRLLTRMVLDNEFGISLMNDMATDIRGRSRKFIKQVD